MVRLKGGLGDGFGFKRRIRGRLKIGIREGLVVWFKAGCFEGMLGRLVEG